MYTDTINTDTINAETVLAFSGTRVQAILVRNVKRWPVRGRATVVNLDVEPAYLAEDPRSRIAGLSATTVIDSEIEKAGAVVVLRTDERAPAADIVTEPGWALFADLIGQETPGATFPREIPLWRSPVDQGPTIDLDAAAICGERFDHPRPSPFRTRLNLWYAPAGTDCGIHNRHDFLETHVQVHGAGRMQKFRAKDPGTHYEDVPMAAVSTAHPPFCQLGDDPRFVYPWHQYRADTDCVWLVVEYHPVG